MAAEERWYFTKEQLMNTPSRKCGIDADKELSYRQQAANFIQDMGQRLQVNQLCINTAIVYVHRFYMFHSFTRFHRNAIATCALFLAAKVEEQPRKLEHVIKVAHMCLHRDAAPLDSKSETYMEQCHELISNENIMLQTLGFDVAIDHPHTHVVKCCQLVRGGGSSLHQHHASKDLAQTSYFMSTNSLHLTTMCLQYKPTVVACVCIHLACKWANWEIPRSSEGKDWFWYVEKTVTLELLEELTAEFLVILDRCPSRLKRKMMSSSNSMNDKIQDTATVEKKLAAEFAQAQSKHMSAPQSQTKTDHKQDRHHEHTSNVATRPPLVTAKINPAGALDHAHVSSDVSAAVTSVEKNGTPKMESWERNAKKENVNSTASVLATTSSAVQAFNLKVEPSTPTMLSPQASDNSPLHPALRMVPSVDQGYSSMVSNSQSQDSFHKSPSLLPTTPQKIKLESSGGSSGGSSRGITPKEYHERKKRERAEHKEKSHALTSLTPSSQQTTTQHDGQTESLSERETPSMQRQRKLSTSSGGSASSFGTLPNARNLKQAMTLASSLSTLTLPRVTSAKHGSLSSKHLQQLVSPEKLNLPENDEGDALMMRECFLEAKRLQDRSIDEGSNHSSYPVKVEPREADEPIPALVRPPILTPSPPLAAGEESKPDILAGKPTTISFPSEDVPMDEQLEHVSTMPSLSAPKDPWISTTDLQHARDRVVPKDHHNILRASNCSELISSSKRHDGKATKERSSKHRKSKTPSAARMLHFGVTTQPPSAATEHTQTSKDNVPASVAPTSLLQSLQFGTFSHVPVTSAASPGDVAVKVEIKQEPRTFSQPLSLPAAQWTVNCGGEGTVQIGSVSVTQERTQPVHSVTASQALRVSSHHRETAAQQLENKGKPLARSPQPLLPLPLLTSEKATTVQLVPSLPINEVVSRVKDKHHQAEAAAPSSSKHERREKHKHRDRDKERPRDKGVVMALVVPIEEPLPPPAPSIKLTIPKDRLNLGSSESIVGNKVATGPSSSKESSSHNSSSGGGVSTAAAGAGGGSLKIKILKEKISGAKSSKASESATHTSSTTAATTQATVERTPKESGGLKIKITKDRLGSKGSYNLSVGGSDSGKSDRESRKRDRPHSPPVEIQRSLVLPGGDLDGFATMSTESKPPKAIKLSSRAARKSGSPQGVVTSSYDVPPSSNTRSSSKQEPPSPQNASFNKQHSGRGHKTGSKPRRGGAGGGGAGVRGGSGMGPLHPHFGHQVTMNAGPYPYQQYFPYAPQPSYFSHPMGPPHHPPPTHHNHPAEYAPQFFGQHPFRPLPPPLAGSSYPTPPPHLMRRHMPPPLPSEPPPAIPPPPPE